MIDQNRFSSVRQSLATAQIVSIFLPQNPNLDKVAASLALFLSLKKSGKQTMIACPTEMTVDFSVLVGVDRVQTKLAGRNLTISFDYIEDSIGKVSYNIENNKFNLVVQPKAGAPPLSTEKVSYFYSGGETDLVFTIGVQNLKDLGELYQTSKPFSEKQAIVGIDIKPVNEQFAKINLIDSTASSCSEVVAQLVSRLDLPVDEDIATNLFLGLERATRSFSSSRVGAATFEAAAFCFRSGARRARPFRPTPAEVSAAKRPKEPPKKQEPPKKPSPDWLEPKIYQGSTRV